MPHLSADAQRATLDVGDHIRTYLTYIPANLPKGAPLIIVLHGGFMNGAMMRKWTGYEFDQLADQHGFAVVYPDGYEQHWNDCRQDTTFPAKTESIDDMGFVAALIDHFKANYGIDPSKVFAFGYSNGGEMTFRLAIETPGEVTAVVAVEANLPTPDASSCARAGRTGRLMLVAGTDDPIMPYAGGKVTLFGFGSCGAVLSALASAEDFAKRNGVTAPPLVMRLPHNDANDPTWVESTSWVNGDTPVVELYTVHGGGHVIPQPAFRFPRLLGKITGDLDSPRTALLFFGIN
jgi:polyhydroxybutyrate depolymerase